MSIKSLPPLHSLVVFEAAARHLNFTRTAEELFVTQGAVSRQVRLLEEFLGKELFIREKRSLRLTNVGEKFYHNVRKSLLILSTTTEEILQKEDDFQVTIATSNAMASYWLLPRFREFQHLYPYVDLRITAVDSLKAMHQSEFDIALFYCRNPPEDFQATPLFNEVIFPVCSPSYLAQNPINEPKDILNSTLLSLDVSEDWFNWKDWLLDSGLSLHPTNPRQIKINSYLLLMQAALNNQGVALGWSNLVDEYLKSGLLVKPLDKALVTNSQYYLLEPLQQETRRSAVQHVRHWLLSHAEQIPAL